MSKTLRLEPYFYIYVFDHLTCLTRIETGPKTFIRLDNEEVVSGPTKMVNLPPKSYVIVKNPIVMDNGVPKMDKNGTYLLQHGETEVRTSEEYEEPFPLYPLEELVNSKLPYFLN